MGARQVLAWLLSRLCPGPSVHCVLSFLAAQEANVKVYAGIKGGAKLRIVQNNSAGDSVSIIDPATNKVVGEIKGIEAPHGVTVAKDGSRIYITSEADDTASLSTGRLYRRPNEFL